MIAGSPDERAYEHLCADYERTAGGTPSPAASSTLRHLCAKALLLLRERHPDERDAIELWEGRAALVELGRAWADPAAWGTRVAPPAREVRDPCGGDAAARPAFGSPRR